jgi:uncharacterized protein YukE
MTEPLRVVTEDLQVSAATVDMHADGMRAHHAAADGRIESSQRGLPAAAAVAFGAAVAKWQGDTAALYRQLVDHSQGMLSGAAGYHLADQSGAADVDAVGNRMPTEPDLGL